jgi:Tol biopolymer transport system component
MELMGARRNTWAVAGAVVAVSAASIAGALPASAAYRGANGVIAFTSARTGTNQVFVRSADGTEKQLTTITGVGGATAPSFSPDGSRIAYVSGSDVWVMRADGTHKVNLTHNAKNNADPTWSPDGAKIAFRSSRDVMSGEIYSVPAGGGTPHRITHNTMAERNLDWAPNGARIAFDASGTGAAPNSQIYVASVSTGAVTNLSSNSYDDSSPDYSPDGSRIAFVSDRQQGGNLWLMNADGSASTPVGTPNVYAAAAAPAWTPDGSAIIIGANMGLGKQQLWSVDQLTFETVQPYNTNPSVQPLHHPVVVVNPPAAPGGSTVGISGSDFLSVQTVKLAFRDAKKHTFALATVHTNAGGAFAKSAKVPAKAAKGAGILTATGVGGLKVSVPFSKS